MDKARAHVMISGRVQGVFFRAYTQKAARARNILGWVMNTRDGRVEAEDMINWCHQGSPMSQVTRVDVDWQSYTGEFQDFSVKYPW